MELLVYRALYHYLGRAENLRWRAYRANWLRKMGNPQYCEVCGVKVWFDSDKHKNLPEDQRGTLDHIIPKSYIFKFGWTDLLYEDSNFELLCKKCNREKGFTFPRELSTPLLKKLQHAAQQSELTPKTVRDKLGVCQSRD